MKTLSLCLALTLGTGTLAAAQTPTVQNTRPQITLNLNEPKSFAFSPKRPRLVILMHGVTNRPASAPYENIDTPTHARWYWGMDLIQALMGVPGREQVKVLQHYPDPAHALAGDCGVTLDSGTTTFENFNPANWSYAGRVLGGKVYPPAHDPLVELEFGPKHKIPVEPDEEPDPKETPAPKNTPTPPALPKTNFAPVILPYSKLLMVQPEAARPSAQKDPVRYVEALFRQSDNPTTGVMVTFRDGSKHLMSQVAEAIDQIYDTYERTFGHLKEENQPQLYLVGHSFGGIVARAILTNPEGPDLFGGKLTAEQRRRADFIRRRVVHVTTMGTPHTGTPIANMCPDMDKVLKLGAAILPNENSLKKHPVLNAITPDLITSNLVGLQEALTDAVKSAGGDRDSLVDITRMAEYNKGILSPEKAVRVDGSVVPFYTMGGRNPGGLFFDRKRAPWLTGGKMRPHNFFDIMDGERFATDAGSLYIIESLLHRMGYGPENTRPWGRTAIPEADIFGSPNKGVGSNISRAQGVTVVWPSLVAGTVLDILTADEYTRTPDGENDTDGFCGFDSYSGLGVTGGVSKPWWWKGLYGSRFGSQMPWDMDNHGSEMFNVGSGLWIHNELIRNAGPTAVQNSDLSVWTPGATKNIAPTHSVKVDVLEVHDVDGTLDKINFLGAEIGTQADFSVTVRIADKAETLKWDDGMRTTKGTKSHSLSNLPQSVIPICISVIDRDLGGPNPDDDCAISSVVGRDNVYVYFDTRTQRIYGDANGAAGEELTVAGYGKLTNNIKNREAVYNRVRLKFRITGN
ncbi:esterase/lipase family protein [Armatimonas rosea]|uniref:GPI inositol-deacylase PGAP1-like alpha/beta domain-containing protein n=1 Tax=Armatimonas rosea TaxID=685828 RepID=A0A7W9W5X0_ARMRO|nr:hypothetical protein [Armatimonas rosea]MBB6050013.1 hypothetical protein [Armatimonas rosea]